MAYPSKQNGLQARRLALGLNPVQLAAAAGISVQQVNNLEAGACLPRLTTARSLANALDTTVDALWPAGQDAAA